MSEVVSFPAKKQEPLIWICNCGCSSFELLSDATARCALCGVISENGGWYTPDADKVWDGDAPVREVAGNGDPEFAKRVTAKRLLEPDVVLAVVLKEDGLLATWTCVETDEQRDWIDRQLDRVKPMLEVGKS